MKHTIKKGLLGIAMGATSLGWAYLMPTVSGNEGYISDRIEIQEPQRRDFALKNGMSYVEKTRDAYVNEAQVQREDGRKFASGLGYTFIGLGALAALAGLALRKYTKGELK